MKPDDPAPSTLVPPPVKQTLRLDYDRFADSIRDKQLVEPAALKQVLDQSQSSGALFTDLLVRDGHLSDWEVSRLAAEVFGLAFLPTEFYEPNTELIECFDSTFLRQNILVPLDRFGDLITVSMPGMVPTEVLREIEEKLSVTVLPVVGSVSGNSAWLEANLPEAKMLKALASEVEAGDGWGELFDAGDAAVQTDLDEVGFADDPSDSTIATVDDVDSVLGSSSAPPADTTETRGAVTNDLDLDLELDLGDR